MPTYAYRCPSCGHEYERLQKITDKTLAKCPECGTRGQRQISGGAGLVFKGSGFYITDYKRGGDKSSSADQGAKPADAAAKPKSDAASDTKKSGADS